MSTCRIPTNSLDEPGVAQTEYGTVAYGTDVGVGYKPHNEDALMICLVRNACAVVDGMGGMERGQDAAQILVETLAEGFESGKGVEELQLQAHERMRREGVIHGGACYIAAQVEGCTLSVYQAGDVKLSVFNREGEITLETRDEGRGAIVLNAVTGADPGVTTHARFELTSGDRIVIASDGLWDSVDVAEAGLLTKDMDTAGAVKRLGSLARERMIAGTGKPDNISIIVWDYRLTRP